MFAEPVIHGERIMRRPVVQGRVTVGECISQAHLTPACWKLLKMSLRQSAIKIYFIFDFTLWPQREMSCSKISGKEGGAWGIEVPAAVY